METTSVMIAEDDESIFLYYKDIFSKYTNVEIVGYAKDGESALKMYKDIKPDVLILDLGLPKKNGLELINDLSNYERENPKCNVIVITGDTRLKDNLLNTRKVYRIILKPAPSDILLKTVSEIKSELITKQFPEHEWQVILCKLKLNPYSKSCKLLTDIIKACYTDSELLDNLKKLYCMMSTKYSCNPNKIQSRLRSCIDTANRLSDKRTFSSLFLIDNYNTSISPKQFVVGLITHLKNIEDSA